MPVNSTKVGAGNELARKITFVIGAGQSLSEAVDLSDVRALAVQLPASINSATALTFQGSADGVTYNNLFDSTGTEVSIAVAASRFVALDPAVFAGIPYLKARTGTSGSPTAQTADITLTLVTHGLG